MSRSAYATYDRLPDSLLKGDIYLARDILHDRDVAVKLESTAYKQQTLEHEFHVLKTLSGGVGIPSVHWFGAEGNYNAIVFDRLGPSLQDLFVRSNFKFSTKTVSTLARQLVSQIKYVHIQAC